MSRTLVAPSELSLALKGTAAVVVIGGHLRPRGREQWPLPAPSPAQNELTGRVPQCPWLYRKFIAESSGRGSNLATYQ